MHILVTAFDSFGNSTTNVSQLVLNKLENNFNEKKIIKKVIPTVFKKENILNLFKEHKFVFLLMLGEDGSRANISLEKVAINYVNARIKDNNGVKLDDQLILKDGNLAYFTKVDLIKLINDINSKNFNLSLSAGSYVCNYSYYLALNHVEKNELPINVLFVHLPKIDDINSLVDDVSNLIKNL